MTMQENPRKRRSVLDLRSLPMARSILNSGSRDGRDVRSFQGEFLSMSIKKMALLAALGLSMGSTSVMAQTAAVDRTGAALVQASGQDNPPYGQGRGRGPVDEDDAGWGSSTTTYIIAFFVVIVILLGLYFAFDEDDEGTVSP
jgi:hypothetical protein